MAGYTLEEVLMNRRSLGYINYRKCSIMQEQLGLCLVAAELHFWFGLFCFVLFYFGTFGIKSKNFKTAALVWPARVKIES